MRSFTFLILSVVLSGFELSAAQAQDRQGPELTTILPHWDNFRDIPEDQRTCFKLAYLVSSGNDLFSDEIHIWYEFDHERFDLSLNDHGLISPLPPVSHLEAKPNIWINESAGSMSVSMQFHGNMDMEATYDTSQISCALNQANGAMRSVGGVAAIFAPKFKEAIFEFETSAPSAWGYFDNGDRIPLTVQENRVLFRPRDRDMRHVTRLEFGRPPNQIRLGS
jgi:hypothetical protein